MQEYQDTLATNTAKQWLMVKLSCCAVVPVGNFSRIKIKGKLIQLYIWQVFAWFLIHGFTISVPFRKLSAAAILSKTNPFCKKQTRSKDKVKSKTMSAIFPSVWIFYLNHHGAEITVIWLVEQSSIKLLILIRY